MDRPLGLLQRPSLLHLGVANHAKRSEKLLLLFAQCAATRDAHLFLQKTVRGSGSRRSAHVDRATESFVRRRNDVLALFEHAFHPYSNRLVFRSLGGKGGITAAMVNNLDVPPRSPWEAPCGAEEQTA